MPLSLCQSIDGVGLLSGTAFRVSGYFFEFFDQTKLKNQGKRLHVDIHFYRDWQFGLQKFEEKNIILLNEN